MSGHSKWKQIKRQKGVADIKRGQAFTKLANAIAIAVRQGRGVEEAIEKARSLNMPRGNIERAIARAKGKAAGENIEEVVYEGFGPGKVAILVEAATDNKMRTASEIKSIFDKNGGALGAPGSVSYQFEIKGLIVIPKNDKSIEDIFLLAADAGALDIEEVEDEVFIYTKAEELGKVKDALLREFPQSRAELIRKPMVSVSISDQGTVNKLLSFIEKLEEADDVLKVYTNYE